MKKKVTTILTSCIAIILIAGGISVFAKGEAKYFKGKNGKVITVYQNEDVQSSEDNKNAESLDETYKVGDVIQVDGHEEEVIAVSEGGGMITEQLEK